MASFTNYVSGLFKTPTPIQMDTPSDLPELESNPEKKYNGSLELLDKENKNCTILFVGGILNESGDVDINTKALQQKTALTIHGFWNQVYATHRTDRVEKQSEVYHLVERIVDLMKSGKVCIIAHSHGSVITKQALEFLSNIQMIGSKDNRLAVFAYGGVEIIPKNLAGQVENYVNKDDLPQILGSKLWRTNKEQQWTILNREGGHPFVGGYDDHAAEKIIRFVRESRD